ncbi:helix-turn-helix domain-containing protein [Paenibacillus sp. YN15]|uniref:helix-turn-helix domain-containing protein n=1 Tax=Paenibacillus sp. YN15 TaxID=1742774 RepID=UPI0015EB4E2B|nr:helix-turn-helix transcriptional regulator [Paenibacillus sp. YN15]
MSDTGHLQNLALNICSLRKQQGLTQEALAEQVGLTFQAVSKWENFQSSPDIQLLPRLAEIFGVSVDRLFGMEKPEPGVEPKLEAKEQELAVKEQEPTAALPVPAGTSPHGLPWEDDGTLRVVLYKGRTLLQSEDAGELKMVFHYEGAALNVESRISVECGDVGGSVQAGQDIRCGEVGGEANAGRDVLCFGVQGNASAGRDVQCSDVGSGVSAGQDVNCGNVSGDASSARDISCGDVGGNVSAMGKVVCGKVDGIISTLGPVSYAGPGEAEADCRRDGNAGEAGEREKAGGATDKGMGAGEGERAGVGAGEAAGEEE